MSTSVFSAGCSSLPKLLVRTLAIVAVALISCICNAASAQSASADGHEADRAVDLRPHVHGALRVRAEGAIDGDERAVRFQVRNARLSLDGHIAPTISYFLQTDLCDRGKMKILDAWGRIDIARPLAIQAGQFRLPFGTDCFRAPSNYIFANRSFIGKQICNIRGVGAKVVSSIPVAPSRTATLEAGVFNPTSMADHDVWVRTLAYAAKLSVPVSRVSLSAGFQSVTPDSLRINRWGASATWTPGPLTFEGEYMYTHYTRSALKTTHSWVLWCDYALPVRLGVFNRASFQARWDAMTPGSSGKRRYITLPDATVRRALAVTDPARQRITLGGTLTYSFRNVHCDIRLDYEKYFRHRGAVITPHDADKLLAELVIRF